MHVDDLRPSGTSRCVGKKEEEEEETTTRMQMWMFVWLCVRVRAFGSEKAVSCSSWLALDLCSLGLEFALSGLGLFELHAHPIVISSCPRVGKIKRTMVSATNLLVDLVQFAEAGSKGAGWSVALKDTSISSEVGMTNKTEPAESLDSRGSL